MRSKISYPQKILQRQKNSQLSKKLTPKLQKKKKLRMQITLRILIKNFKVKSLIKNSRVRNPKKNLKMENLPKSLRMKIVKQNPPNSQNQKKTFQKTLPSMPKIRLCLNPMKLLLRKKL